MTRHLIACFGRGDTKQVDVAERGPWSVEMDSIDVPHFNGIASKQSSGPFQVFTLSTFDPTRGLLTICNVARTRGTGL